MKTKRKLKKGAAAEARRKYDRAWYTRMKAKPPQPKIIDQTKDKGAAVVKLEIQLPSPDATVELKLRSHTGEMLGTTICGARGQGHKRPNQKTVPQLVAFKILERLSEMGFIVEPNGQA